MRIIYKLLMLFYAGIVYPANITSITPNIIDQTSIIELTIEGPSPCQYLDPDPPLVNRTENDIRLDLNVQACLPVVGVPPEIFKKNIGPLEEGTYNLRLFTNGFLNNIVQIQVFQVTHPASIPSLNDYGVFSLIVLIMLVSLVYRKKYA